MSAPHPCLSVHPFKSFPSNSSVCRYCFWPRKGHPIPRPVKLEVVPDPEPGSEPPAVPEEPSKFPDLKSRWLQWVREKRGKRKRKPHPNYASQIGHPCERFLYLSATGAASEEIGDELASLFQFGDDYEDAARVNYLRMGFTVERSQESFEATDPDTGEVLWRGRVDGIIRDKVTGAVFAQDTKTSRDAQRLRPDLEAKYRAQQECYMSPDALDLPLGMIILWDKGVGIPEQINLEQSAERYGALMDKARRINAAVEAEEPPDFIMDPDTCRRCPYNKVSCWPSVTVDATSLIICEQTASELDEALELERAGKRHTKLSEELKDRFKGNKDGAYLTASGVQVTVKTNKGGARRIRWWRPEKGEDE